MLRRELPGIRTEVIEIDRANGIFTKQYQASKHDMLTKFAVLEEVATKAEFTIPKVLGAGEGDHAIRQTYIPGLTPVRLLLADRALMPGIMRRIGRGLAQVHAGLAALEIPAIDLPETLTGPGPKTFLHLDFNTVNVQVHRASQKIYFLDWELSPMLRSLGNHGSIYYDLVHFIYQIYLNEPYLITSKSWKDKLVSLFLEGYCQISDDARQDELAQFAGIYLRVFEPFDRQVWWKYQLKRNNLANFRHFLHRLSTSGTLLCAE